MNNRKFSIFSLILAYSILLLHSIVPHHHHTNFEEALHHHHGENLHHPHEKSSDDQGHTHHLVHSPEFGNSILLPTIDLQELDLQIIKLFVYPFDFYSINSKLGFEKLLQPPDEFIPYYSILPLVKTLRGPPIANPLA